MACSGINARIARKTESPPTPESNTPMGEFVEGMEVEILIGKLPITGQALPTASTNELNNLRMDGWSVIHSGCQCTEMA